MSKLVSGYSLAVAASSTFAVITLSMALVAETATQLQAQGVKVRPFVSPNVTSTGPEHNRQVFDEYIQMVRPRLR
jgi:uncharacterized phosphosugar-binding protein